MNISSNAISNEIDSVTTQEERNHFKDKPDAHEGETPAEQKRRKYKTQTEKAEIKERRDRQRTLEKLHRDTARKAERQAQREAIRRGITTDSNRISSNSAEDVTGSTTTLLGTAVSGSAVGTVTTANTAIFGGVASIPVGIAAGAIITSGTANASSEHAVEIHPNSKSTENTKGKNKIQRMDHAPNDRQINDDQIILLNPDQNMDEIQVDHIRNLDRFLPPLSNFRPLQGFYRDIPLAELEEHVRGEYHSQPVHLHSFNDGDDDDIPIEYAYLRNNIENFRGSVNLAKDYVDVALNKLTQTFMNNEQGRFEINHEHPLVMYAEKVFVTTDNNILANIAIRLHDSISNIKMYFDENHDIYFATANNNIDYHLSDECTTMAFVLNDDEDKRIVVLVDNFEETADVMDSPRATVSQTVLHEALHHAIGSSDFITSPTTVTTGNALDFMELMNEVLSPSRPGQIDRECLQLDPYFFNAYKNFIGDETITPAQFLKKLQVDPMLKANVMIDNADFLAIMIYDIAANQTFPETPLRELIRPRRNVVV